MTSVVGFWTFAKLIEAPVVVFVAFHQEYPVLSRLSAIPGIDRSPHDCQRGLDQIHRAVSKMSRLYGEIYETTDWIASDLPRNLGIGKNAGG